MKQFDIFVNNRPGELAKVTEILSANGINIITIASERTAKPLIRIVTDDERSTKSALERAKVPFKECPLIVLDLTDRPGELAKVARKLANQGVNVDSIHILGKKRGKTSIGLVVDKTDRAKKLLR